MSVPPQARLLPGGRRLHLQHGPIDLVVEAVGADAAVASAYRAATARFATILEELCAELPLLRARARPVDLHRRADPCRASFRGSRSESPEPIEADDAECGPTTGLSGDPQRQPLWVPGSASPPRNDPGGLRRPRYGDDADESGRPLRLQGVVARRMHAAVLSFARDTFITPMAAVAGAVADEILAAMRAAAELRRASVNNGGDIALHLASGESLRIGLVDRPDRPGLFGTAILRAEDGIGGIATSGWRGRSFSLGIADAVTILARTAAEADAAATVVANAVDLPGHPAVTRVPAREAQEDSDLGEMPVTRGVGLLARGEIERALDMGLATAAALRGSGLIESAALHLQGLTRIASRRAPSTRRQHLEAQPA